MITWVYKHLETDARLQVKALTEVDANIELVCIVKDRKEWNLNNTLPDLDEIRKQLATG